MTSPSSDKLTVANGFEWGFEPFIAANEHGKLFFAKSLPAGASTDLLPATEEELNDVATALQRDPMELPAGIASGGTPIATFWGTPPARRAMYSPWGVGTASWRHQESLMEQAWLRLRTGAVVPGNIKTNVSPVGRSFYGIAAQAPHVELGVPKATEIHSTHVVMGRW